MSGEQPQTADAQAPLHPTVNWEEEKMRLSGTVLFNKALRDAFLEKMAAAPSLKTLELSLKERFGRRRMKLCSTLPPLICSKAPAQIKELILQFGYSSKDAVFSLLEKTRDHLEHLEIKPQYQQGINYTDADLCRLWQILEGSSIKSLTVHTYSVMRKVKFSFKVNKWNHLEKLKYSPMVSCTATVLPALITANKTSLRVVELPSSEGVLKAERRPVFTALSKCVNLEEVMLDCFEETPLLQTCPKLKNVTFMNVGGMLSNNSAATKAIGKFLSLPTSIQRIEKVTLGVFQDPKTASPIFKALSLLKGLKSLTVNVCTDFPNMKNTLKNLPCLEELHLNQGAYVKAARVAQITPDVVPNLKVLKVRCESSTDRDWKRQVKAMESAFKRNTPDFKLEDLTDAHSDSDGESSSDGRSEDFSDSDDSQIEEASDDDDAPAGCIPS